MPIEYRVVDLRTEVIDPEERIVTASKPEEAAEMVLGEKVARGNQRFAKPIARVYYQKAGQPLTMLRLYRAKEAGAP